MIITFSQQTYQGAGFLHTAPPPTRPCTPRPPVLSVGTRSIRYGRGCGLAQAIQEVECGGLDIVSLTEKIWVEVFSNNWRGYNVI